MKKRTRPAVFLTALMAATVCIFAGASAINAGPFDNLGDLEKIADDAKKLTDAAKEIDDAGKPWKGGDERATGRVLAARVAGNFGGVWTGSASAKEWNEYVNKIGRALAIVSNRPDIKYRFAILNTNDVNAYSAPGGYIYVTKGLLKAAENEAELAGVLAHEIAHVSERHIEKEMRKQAVGSKMLEHGLSFAESQGELSAADVKQITSLSETGYKVLIEKGYAKQDEFEADEAGTKTMVKLGYSPNGLLTFVKKFEAMEKDLGGKMKVLASTHPASKQRVNRMFGLMKDKGWKAADGQSLKWRYKKMLEDHPL